MTIFVVAGLALLVIWFTIRKRNAGYTAEPDRCARIPDPVARGQCYFAEGYRDRAIEAFTEAITLAPDAADLYTYRASVYHRAARYDDAIADYNRAIALRPNNATYYYFRGNTYHMAGRDVEALADMNEALRIQPSYAKAIDNKRFIEAYMAEHPPTDTERRP